MLSSKQFDGQCDMKEPWYQTDYKVASVPKEWIDTIQGEILFIS